MLRTATLVVLVGASLALFAGTAVAATIDGDYRNNRLFGTEGVDNIRGGGGNDVVAGRSGADTLLGGLGNDRIYGGQGNDEVFGGRGDDIIHVEGDNDFGNGVADRVNCGPGEDTAYVDSGGFNGENVFKRPDTIVFGADCENEIPVS